MASPISMAPGSPPGPSSTASPPSASTATPPEDTSLQPRLVVRRTTLSNPLLQRPVRRQRPPPAARPARNKRLPSIPSATANTSNEATKPTVDDDEWVEYKLFTTKRSLTEGQRHHIIRIQSKRLVNLNDAGEFTRPIRLHRRDPSAPFGGAKAENVARMEAKRKGREMVDEVETKKEAESTAKEAAKTANLTKIAPYGGAQHQKKDLFKKKTQQVFHGNEQEKKLRYEENFPWFIEDFDNKNTWQGHLQGALSGTYAMLTLDEGKFNMIPIEKWYKFTEKNKFKALTTEEAEAEMKKNSRISRWLMNVTKTDEKLKEKMQAMENARVAGRTMLIRRGDRLEGLPKSETADADDLDFEDDRFADDEEAPIMDGLEEDRKEIERRIKKEQLSANVFDTRGEKEYEAEEAEKRRLEAARRKLGKGIRETLRNREGNYIYESDSDGDPYGSSEEEVDSEAEAIMAQERKKEEACRKAEEAQAEKEAKEAKAAKEALVKKAKEVHAKDAKKKGVEKGNGPDPTTSATNNAKMQDKPAVSLKRTGSDDASTSESNSRRICNTGENQARSSSPRPTLNPSSQAAGASKKRKSQDMGPPAGKTAEAGQTAGEMSDGPGAAKKQRVVKSAARGRACSPTGAPGTSRRQTSPVSAAGNVPVGRTGAPAAPVLQPTEYITDDEIRSAVPPDGATFVSIAATFNNRIKTKAVKGALIASLKRLTETRGKRMYLK